MNKRIALFLPFIALAMTGCGNKSVLPKGGTEIDVSSIGNKVVDAINATFTYDALGYEAKSSSLKLDIKGNYPMSQTSVMPFKGSASVSNLTFKAGLINLNSPMEDLEGSVDVSAKYKIDIKADGSSASSASLFNLEGSPDAHMYVRDEKIYFNYNEDTYNLITSFIAKGASIPVPGKYYQEMDLPSDMSYNDNVRYSLSYAKESIVNFFDNIPDMAKEFVSAYQYSDTKYALYASADLDGVRDIISIIFHQQFPLFTEKDTFLAEAAIVFDTEKGVSNLAVKANINAAVTVEQYLTLMGGSQMVSNYSEEVLTKDFIRAKGSLSLNINFLTDKAVKVSSIKDTSDYEKIGGDSKSKYYEEVDFDTFSGYALSRPSEPTVKGISVNGYFSGEFFNFYADENSYEYLSDSEKNLTDDLLENTVDYCITTDMTSYGMHYYITPENGFMMQMGNEMIEFSQYGRIIYISSNTSDHDLRVSWYY